MGDLVVFLAEDEKERVQKLNNFGEPHHCVGGGVSVWAGGDCVCMC